jgi:hypothetical protein
MTECQAAVTEGRQDLMSTAAGTLKIQLEQAAGRPEIKFEAR